MTRREEDGHVLRSEKIETFWYCPKVACQRKTYSKCIVCNARKKLDCFKEWKKHHSNGGNRNKVCKACANPTCKSCGENMDMYDLFGKMMLEGRAQIGIAENAESRRRRSR